MNRFISLGSRCQIAVQLRRNGLRDGLYPFDWLVSDNFDSVYRMIRDDFEGLFASDQYWMCRGEQWFGVVCKRYWVGDSHDFRHEDEVEAKLPEVQAKFRRAVRRFHVAMRSGDHCFLFRKGMSAQQGELLSHVIEQKYPRAQFTLVRLLNKQFTYHDAKHRFHRGVTHFINYPPNQTQGAADYDLEWNILLKLLNSSVPKLSSASSCANSSGSRLAFRRIARNRSPRLSGRSA